MSSSNRNLEVALRIRTMLEGAGSVEELRRGMGGLADEMEQAGQDAGRAGDQLDDLEDSGRRAGAGARDASSGMDNLVEGVKAFMTLAAAKQILDLNDRLATLKRGFEAATGSQKGAADALEFVRSVADRLGVSVFDLSQSYLKITAAAKGTQLEGKATEQIFSSLAGAMSVVGATADDVDNAMNAVAQMMSKGVISAEELRGQLGDVLPGAAQQAAQALLVTNAEFNKMLESGEVIASEFLPKFAVQLEQVMGGGGTQVETFGAAVARVQNRLIDLATGETGQALTRFATLLVTALEPALRGLEAVDGLIGAVGRAMGGLAAGESNAALSDFADTVAEIALNLVGLKSEAQQAAERQKQLAEEAKAATPEINRLQDAVVRGEIKALPEHLQAAVTELRNTGDAAAATQQAIGQFLASINKNINFEGVINLATALKVIGQEATGAGDDIQEVLGAALEKLSDEQLERLKQQAEQAMAKASKGSEEARKAFSDLGLVVDTVARVQLARAAQEADKVADAARNNTSALEQLIDAQREGIQTEIAIARAKGQTWVAQQKSAELAQLEVQWAGLLAAAKQAEIAAEQASLQAKIAVMQAAGLKTEEDKKEYAALQLKLAALNIEYNALLKNAELKGILAGQANTQNKELQTTTDNIQTNTAATQQNAEATDKAAKSGGSLAAVVASLIDFWRDHTASLSESTKALFEWNAGLSKVDPQYGRDVIGGISEEAQKAAQRIGELNGYIGQMSQQMLFSTNSVGRYMDMIGRAGALAEKSYYEQKLQAEAMAQQLAKVGEAGQAGFGTVAASLQFVNDTAKTTRQSLWLLNDQDMSQLQEAIDGANDRLREMQDEAQAATDRLAELDAQIARERGNTDAADRMDLEREKTKELADAEKALADARAANNQVLVAQIEEQIRKLGELYSLKERNLEQDIRDRNANADSSPPPGGTTTTYSRPPGGGGSTINLSVNLPNALLADRRALDELAYKLKPSFDDISRRLL